MTSKPRIVVDKPRARAPSRTRSTRPARQTAPQESAAAVRNDPVQKTVHVEVLWDMAAITRSLCTVVIVALIVIVAALNDELVIGLTSAGAVAAGGSMAGAVRSVFQK